MKIFQNIDKRFKVCFNGLFFLFYFLFAYSIFCSPDRLNGAESILRIKKDSDQKPAALQTPILHLRRTVNQETVELDLIGAIHIGEPDYYAELNRRLDAYETACVEMILPENADLAQIAPRRSRSLPADPLETVPWLQIQISRILGLVPQLTAIDYSRPNRTAADLTLEALRREITQNSEPDPFLTELILFFLTDEPLTLEERIWIFRGFCAIAARDRQMALRRLAAQLLCEDAFSAESGSVPSDSVSNDAVSNGSASNDDASSGSISAEADAPPRIPFEKTIIFRRNQAAVEKVLAEIAAGKHRIALFYGTEHLADLSERFQKLGFRPAGRDWIDAWRLQNRSDEIKK